MTRRKYSEDAESNEVINQLYADIRLLKEQNRQLSLALGATKIDCTYAQFVAEIRRKNREIAEVLDLAIVRRFERGRLWLAFRGLTLEQQFIVNWQLKDFLQVWTAGRWRCKPFVIKIKILS